MAKLLPLASIYTMADMRNYALAEAADAASKCPAAYNEYYDAIRLLDTYSEYAGGPYEISAVQQARDAVLKARQTWHSVNCPDPTVASPEPKSASSSVITPAQVPGAVVSAMGFGNIGQFLLVGGALFAAMLVFSKKPKGKGKKTARRRRR
jgi:hypothetical protein